MPKYSVILPVAGIVHFSGVEAANEEDAIAKALENPFKQGDVQELNSYSKLVDGSFICVDTQDEASAEEEDGHG